MIQYKYAMVCWLRADTQQLWLAFVTPKYCSLWAWGGWGGGGEHFHPGKPFIYSVLYRSVNITLTYPAASCGVCLESRAQGVLGGSPTVQCARIAVGPWFSQQPFRVSVCVPTLQMRLRLRAVRKLPY